MSALSTPAAQARVGERITYQSPEPLGAASIRYFALAIGSDPDRWLDRAPPTLLFETNQLTGRSARDDAGYLGHTWDLPLTEPTAMIRGGNDYRIHRPVRPDDLITTTWTLRALDEREDRDGHPLLFVVADATYTLTGHPSGALLATNAETLLYRPLSRPLSRPAGSASRPSGSPDRDGKSTATGESEPGAPLRAESEPGQRLADLVRPIELCDLVAYGGATWDWHRLHYDPDFARRAGLGRPVVDGQMLGAILAEQIVRASDGAAEIARLAYRNRAPALAGDVITCRATVRRRRAGGPLSVDQRAVLGDGTVAATAETDVHFP